jgi:hypothetical protein
VGSYRIQKKPEEMEISLRQNWAFLSKSPLGYVLGVSGGMPSAERSV